jgi:hypothetical protein
MTTAAVRKMDNPPERLDKLKLAAVHEVSHRVIADVSGIKCSWMKIRRHFFSGEVSGGTFSSSSDMEASGWKTDPDDPRYFKPTPEQCLAFYHVCIAGGIGVKYWFIRGWQDTSVDGVPWNYGTRCDMRMAREVAHYAKLNTAACPGRVMTLVHQNWPRIARGAQLLHRIRSLPARRV